MAWWILTFLENHRAWSALTVLSATHRADHLFMSWSHYKPSRTPVYRRIRGTTIWCGYKYIWDTPNVVEQNEPGDTLLHTFGPLPLQPTDHVWYYLWSIAGAFDQPCQGPLIHVMPWETTVPSCRVTSSILLPIPDLIWTAIDFDTARWDDGDFHEPAVPSVLKAPIPGLYEMGVSITVDTAPNTGLVLRIRLNGGLYIAEHRHWIGANGWEGTGISLHTIWPLDIDHYIQAYIYHDFAPPQHIEKESDYSPEFWIAYIGPYPL